jgi:hypothetical protein
MTSVDLQFELKPYSDFNPVSMHPNLCPFLFLYSSTPSLIYHSVFFPYRVSFEPFHVSIFLAFLYIYNFSTAIVPQRDFILEGVIARQDVVEVRWGPRYVLDYIESKISLLREVSTVEVIDVGINSTWKYKYPLSTYERSNSTCHRIISEKYEILRIALFDYWLPKELEFRILVHGYFIRVLMTLVCFLFLYPVDIDAPYLVLNIFGK